MTATVTAKIVELSIGTRAIVDQRGDTTFVCGSQALTLRRREVERFIGAYTRADQTMKNGGGKT